MEPSPGPTRPSPTPGAPATRRGPSSRGTARATSGAVWAASMQRVERTVCASHVAFIGDPEGWTDASWETADDGEHVTLDAHGPSVRVTGVCEGSGTVDALDEVVYGMAERVAEGFNACLVVAAAGPCLADGLFDGDETGVVSVLVGYVLDFFAADPVAVDVSSFALDWETATCRDLLHTTVDGDGDTVHTVIQPDYGAKWGFGGGGLATRLVSSLDDLAQLPTADTVSAALGGDGTVVVQLRIRRAEPVTLGGGSGAFTVDVVQTATLVVLPAAAHLTGAPLLDADPATHPRRIVAGLVSPVVDDTGAVLSLERPLTTFLRGALDGDSYCSWITLATTETPHGAVRAALADGATLSSAAVRPVRPQGADEVARLMALRKERDAAAGLARCVMESHPGAALEVHAASPDDLPTVVAASPAAAPLVADDRRLTAKADGAPLLGGAVGGLKEGAELTAPDGRRFHVGALLRPDPAVERWLLLLSPAVDAEEALRTPPPKEHCCRCVVS